MDKILVEIKCPSTSQSYDFRISKKLTAKEALKKIVDEIRLYERNDKLFADNAMLFSPRLNCILNPSMTMVENSVCGGDVIVIM